MLSKIPKPPKEYVQVATCILACLLIAVQLCSCDVTWSIYYKQDNTRLTNFYELIWKNTNGACCITCHVDRSCKGVSYNPGSKECRLSNARLVVIGSNSETNDDWVTFSSTDPVCANYLVSGENGVEDSQLTNSTNYCAYRPESCGSPTDYSAIHARLNSNSAWISKPRSFSSLTQYVQVDFRLAKVIAATVLQGRDSHGTLLRQYVTRFRVLTSLDCNKFTYISNGTNTEVIFEGPSSPEEIVVRYLPQKVIARCVRINPVAFAGTDMSLRFDVLGC